jgi:hypothetical protein
MNRALGLVVVVAVVSVGCGDNFDPAGLTAEQVHARLRLIPGVTVEEVSTEQEEYRYYVLQFTQPVDHHDPSLGTFQQQVSLLHRSSAARVPMIIHTSGYADYVLDRPVELTKLLAANQVSIEHRYFGGSRPVPTDWSKLTIAQAAADEHEIIVALRSVYDGAFLTTGGSKGGMTAVFHRRFYPDDVEGTVAYVAPISFGTPDPRYARHMSMIGGRGCRQAVQDLAVELLSRRREAMYARAESQTEHSYTRVKLGAALEAAIVALEWTFWQFSGDAGCEMLPPLTADDETLFAFLDKISPVSDSEDAKLAGAEAYYYQSHAELGYPDSCADYLAPYLRYSDSDYLNELPGPPPAHDSNAMRDIQEYVEEAGDRMLFVYGEWDPWTGGKFALGNASDSVLLTHKKGTHGAKIGHLELSEMELALTMLRRWTGVVPNPSRLHREHSAFDNWAERLPRVPPAVLRALHARK